MDLLLTHGYFLAQDAQERRVMKPYPPMGLLYVSSHLKALGFSVGVFDSTFESFESFGAYLARARPSVVGLYCNLMTKRNVLRMAALCRRVGARVVVGGPEPPSEAEEYLARDVDAVVIGEGEVTLAELVPLLIARPGSRDWSDVAGIVYRNGQDRVVRTRPRALIRNLDAQPWPDREAVDIPAYLRAWRDHHGFGSISLLTARGCPFTCRWCSRSVFGETHRRRSAASVADEVQWICERYHPDQLWYVDDVFTIHPGFVRALADEMQRRSLHVPFECISRADRLDADTVDALARLGCRRLWIGSESGSQGVLDAMDRRVTVEQVQQATRQLQARGIQVGMFIMLGYEGEEPADLRATVDHLKTSSPDVFLTTVAYPIKGTPYHQELAGRLRSDLPWEERTDRDATVVGRRTPLYYRFARQWMESEVARDRHWRAGRYLRAARAATRAGAGRLGMAVCDGQRVR